MSDLMCYSKSLPLFRFKAIYLDYIAVIPWFYKARDAHWQRCHDDLQAKGLSKRTHLHGQLVRKLLKNI